MTAEVEDFFKDERKSMTESNLAYISGLICLYSDLLYKHTAFKALYEFCKTFASHSSWGFGLFKV